MELIKNNLRIFVELHIDHLSQFYLYFKISKIHKNSFTLIFSSSNKHKEKYDVIWSRAHITILEYTMIALKEGRHDTKRLAQTT